MYALSDRRALIVRRFFGERFTSQPLDGQVRLSRQKGTAGTLKFGAPNPFSALNGMSLWLPGFANEVSFDQIPDVMQAYSFSVQPPQG